MTDREPSCSIDRKDNKESDRITICIRYEDEAGKSLSEDCREVRAGDDFAISAEIREGCSCTGCRLDEQQPVQDHFMVLHDLREDHTVTFLYAPVEHLCRVTEYYLDGNGAEAGKPATSFLTPGSNYCRTVPELEGYTPAGYILNNGPMMQEYSILISNITQDHTIIWLYAGLESQQELRRHRVTVSCQTISDGTYLLADTCRLLSDGENFRMQAPVLEGVRRAGHILNATSLSTLPEVIIPQVHSDQYIVFVYEYGAEEQNTQEMPDVPTINISVPVRPDQQKLIVTLLDALLAGTADQSGQK